MIKLLFYGAILFFLTWQTACTKTCTNCNVRQIMSCSDSTIVGYPSDETNDRRYCDKQIDELIQSQGTFVYEYPKGNGDKYTITETLIVKCD